MNLKNCSVYCWSLLADDIDSTPVSSEIAALLAAYNIPLHGQSTYTLSQTTENADVILGGDNSDQISGSAGNDVLVGRMGK
jgi:Ca2+-binding RTX toxin-like protein